MYVQVVTSFILTSMITILFALSVVLMQVNKLLSDIKSAPTPHLPRSPSVQQAFTALGNVVYPFDWHPTSLWARLTTHFLIGLSDQQLLTGIAIIIVGFIYHCDPRLQSRHFWVVFDLSYLSAVTHLASLRGLRSYLHTYPRYKHLRVALMLSNYIMLLAASVLTFGNYDNVLHTCSIQCTFNSFNVNNGFGVSGIHAVEMVLLTLGTVWQIHPLYASPQQLSMRHDMIVNVLTGRPMIDGRKTPPWRAVLLVLLYPPALLVWMLLAVMWGLGLSRLLNDRQWALPEENLWGFGQVLPMLLLALPLFTVGEVWHGEYRTSLLTHLTGAVLLLRAKFS